MLKTDDTKGVILFDGTCVFCRGSVGFIAARDPQNYFKFGASQSDAAQPLREGYGLDAVTARSIVLIEGDRAYLKSTAALRIAARLTFPWSLARFLLFIPRPIRDAVYEIVAAIRHRIAGKVDVCEIPPPGIRGRLL